MPLVDVMLTQRESSMTGKVIGVAVVIVLHLGGCNSEEKTTSRKQVTSLGNSIRIKPETMPKVRIGTPELIDTADRWQVAGQIGVNEHELLYHVSAYMTGRITKIHAVLGDKVKEGTVLAHISSPQLTKAQLNYLSALSQKRLTEKALERAHGMLEAHVISAAEVDRRQSDFEIAAAELDAAADHLRLLGVDNDVLKKLAAETHIFPSLAITSPKRGVVIERNVTVGQVVEPSDQLFRIADLSSVWVVGAVPEQFVRNVEIGKKVEIFVPALSYARLEGHIVFVADMVNPATRTVEIKTEVENPQRELKPSMLATMYISERPHENLAVPEGAVVREGSRDYVFTTSDNSLFQRIPVNLGPEIRGMRPVLKGLDPQQRIVLEGATSLEIMRQEVPHH
jgi:cobalt-zinc-cadmium efflux system membrane fusion protein